MTSTCAEAAGNQLSRNDAKDITRGCHMDSPLLDNQHVECKIIITHNGLQVIETSRNPHRSHLQLRRPLLDASTTVRILVRSKLCEEVLYRRVNQIIPRGYKLAQLYKSDDAGAADMALFELKILPARHQHAPPDVPPLNLLGVLQPKKGSLCTTYDGTRTCLPMTAPGYLENNLDYTKLHKVFTGQWPFESSKEDVTGVLHCILPEHIVTAIVRIEKLPNKKRTLEACEQRSKPSSYHLYVNNADAVRFLISHEQMTYRCNAFMVITKDPERRYGTITFSHASSTFRHATAINQEKEVATTSQL